MEDLGVNGIILRTIFKKCEKKKSEWTDLVQDRDRLWAVVNVGTNLRVP